MAGGEEGDGGHMRDGGGNTPLSDTPHDLNKPVFPSYPDTIPPPTLLPPGEDSAIYNTPPDIDTAESLSSNATSPYHPSPPTPHDRSDPPASTADEPVSLPVASDDSYSEHMNDVLAKVGHEVAAKTHHDESDNNQDAAHRPGFLTENLSTDPNMPVFMKRKRGRPRKHPLPEGATGGRQREGNGRRAGRPPKTANRVLPRRIKKEMIEEPMFVDQILEDELSTRLQTEQSTACEDNEEENAIRFADVGNHLPLLVTGQHLCAVCLSRHGHRQTSGVRRTRSTSFKRFTSVVCRTCNKFLCIAPRPDGRTCFDIYHTMQDFVRAELPEFNRKDSGDSDIVSAEFDNSPDLTEDTTMLLELLQAVSGEAEKGSELDEDRKPLDTSSETVFPERAESQEVFGSSEKSENMGEVVNERLQTSAAENEMSTKDGQSKAISLLLRVLKHQRTVTVSDTLQLRLERRPRKYNMSNRNATQTVYAVTASTASVSGSPEELTRKYRRKGRPRKHVSTDEDTETEKGEDLLEDAISLDPAFKGFSQLITPGTRRKYACGRCHAEFNLIARMKVHLKAHIERKTYSCNTCSASFRTKGKLAEHRKQHKTEKIHKCPKCDESFKKMIQLRRHMRTHQDSKPYECRVCNAKFSYASSLKEHALNKHLGERPFKCSECDQGFIRQMNLLEHMRIHTGERPFKCKHCDQSFARKSGLKSHMISHTGEKKHMCNTCGARFRHKIALTEHQRTHTGEKPFACSHCGQRFAASTTLRNHVRLHTGEKPHTCKVCGAGFAQRTSLNCHLKKHGINPPETKSPKSNWSKGFKQDQGAEEGMLGAEAMNLGVGNQIDSDHSQGLTPQGHSGQGHNNQGQDHSMSSLHHVNTTPDLGGQPQDYSDKSSLSTSQSHLGGHSVHNTTGDSMMAQAVSMAFSKMVPDMLQGGMSLQRRPDSAGPSSVSNMTSQPPPTPPSAPPTPIPHSMSHHQGAPQHHHHALVSTHRALPHHDPLQTSSHLQPSNHLPRPMPGLLHSTQDVHTDHLERPPSHASHTSSHTPSHTSHTPSHTSHTPSHTSSHTPSHTPSHTSHTSHSLSSLTPSHTTHTPSLTSHMPDIKPMALTTGPSPWGQDPTANIPAFPYDPTFHQQMNFPPGMLPGQPNHVHPSYPEQPRFPFDNRFSMDGWHGNWKHKYQ